MVTGDTESNSSKASASRGADLVTFGAIAVGVWLAWQIIQAPLILRGPPALAARLAPTSPEALGRIAESEFVAGRRENAKALADEALARAPFNVRALRVRGLAEAQSGDTARADEILTLAGNWSLRDDPAHAWLVENRLRRGDFASAFAHADTLARRREEMYPTLFELFRLASDDARGIRALAGLLEASPPWRGEFLDYLFKRKDADRLLGTLAIVLESTDGPFTSEELQRLHSEWTGERRFEALRALRQQMRRPPLTELVADSGFEGAGSALYPFGWLLGAAPGISATVVDDDLANSNHAVRFEYDGVGAEPVLNQLLLLAPGRFQLSGRERFETSEFPTRTAWTVTCIETGTRIAQHVPSQTAISDGWRTFRIEFDVPSQDCAAQSLTLLPRPGDRRTTISGWADDMTVTQVAANPTAPE